MIQIDVLLNAAEYYFRLEGFQRDRIIEMFLQKEGIWEHYLIIDY